jgi:hypothetical protein
METQLDKWFGFLISDGCVAIRGQRRDGTTLIGLFMPNTFIKEYRLSAAPSDLSDDQMTIERRYETRWLGRACSATSLQTVRETGQHGALRFCRAKALR